MRSVPPFTAPLPSRNPEANRFKVLPRRTKELQFDQVLHKVRRRKFWRSDDGRMYIQTSRTSTTPSLSYPADANRCSQFGHGPKKGSSFHFSFSGIDFQTAHFMVSNSISKFSFQVTVSVTVQDIQLLKPMPMSVQHLR